MKKTRERILWFLRRLLGVHRAEGHILLSPDEQRQLKMILLRAMLAGDFTTHFVNGHRKDVCFYCGAEYASASTKHAKSCASRFADSLWAKVKDV